MQIDVKTRRMSSLAIWIVAIVLIFAPAIAVDDKCAACEAVAAEIERGLASERPRNHLDMRHRLDSRGQREGKVIDYKISELRVVELLDGLCDKMQDYTLIKKPGAAKKEWIKVKAWDTLGTDKQEARTHSKAISSYCGRLIEETEDDLAEKIRKGTIAVGQVNKVLCQELSKHCTSTRDYTNLADEDRDL
ncbi:TLR4 regulator/MIR-interacting MSAP protein [Wolffia australiana]